MLQDTKAVILFAVLLVAYLMESVSAYYLSKKAGVSFPFLSFVPILRPYNFFQILCGDRFELMGVLSIDKTAASVVYIVLGVVAMIARQVSMWFYVPLLVLYLFLRAALYVQMCRSLRLDNIGLFVSICLLFEPVGLMCLCFSYSANQKRAEAFSERWEDVMGKSPDYRIPKEAAQNSFEEAIVSDDGDDFTEGEQQPEEDYGFYDDSFFENAIYPSAEEDDVTEAEKLEDEKNYPEPPPIYEDLPDDDTYQEEDFEENYLEEPDDDEIYGIDDEDIPEDAFVPDDETDSENMDDEEESEGFYW